MFITRILRQRLDVLVITMAGNQFGAQLPRGSKGTMIKNDAVTSMMLFEQSKFVTNAPKIRRGRHVGCQSEHISAACDLYSGSGTGNHLVQHVLAFQAIGLVSRWQSVALLVEPCSLLVSKHTAVRFPSASVLYLLPCSGTQGGVDGRSAVPCHVWHQWLDRVSQPCRLDHFAPRHQEVVITEVEDAFRGVSMAESCCSQWQALAPGTVQLDRVVGRICFGPQRSVFWVKKHLMTGADSLKRNLDVSSLNGQWLPWPEVARHHPQQVNAHAPVPLPQKFQNQHCPHAPHMRVSAPRRSTAFPTLEGTMAAWQEMTPVLPELRKVVAHCPKQNVAGRTAVPQSIFLVEESHEALVDLCIRDERVFCHQSVLEELLQGLVVANGVFHCVNFQEGEGFFGMSVHRRCAVGDKSPSLPTHVGIGLLLGGRRIGFVPPTLSCPVQYSPGIPSC